MKSYFNLKV